MRTKELTQTRDLAGEAEQYGVTRFLASHYLELMSLGAGPERAVCRLLRDNLVSRLGLNYLSKLNLLMERKLIATGQEAKDDLCRWIDNDVMEAISGLCETDVFDNPRGLSALSDIAIALYSSLDMIDEEDLEEEMDYLLDIPYRLNELAKESPHIAPFYKAAFKREEEDSTERASISISAKNVSVRYTVGARA